MARGCRPLAYRTYQHNLACFSPRLRSFIAISISYLCGVGLFSRPVWCVFGSSTNARKNVRTPTPSCTQPSHYRRTTMSIDCFFLFELEFSRTNSTHIQVNHHLRLRPRPRTLHQTPVAPDLEEVT